MLLLTSYSIMPGLRPHGAVDLFRGARQGGTRTAVDIGPAIGEPARQEELRPLLAHTDFFICNEHELQVCTRERRNWKQGWRLYPRGRSSNVWSSRRGAARRGGFAAGGQGGR